MQKNNALDDRYNYYVYRMDKNTDIEEIFNNGIVFGEENLLQHNILSDVYEYGLNNALRIYSDNHGCNDLIVIKIPSYYMGWIHRDNSLEPFVPLFKCFYDSKTGFEVRNLIPSLICGVYKNNQYIENENYNPLYDPSGLQFSDRQINTMYRYRCFDAYMEAMCRNEYTYEVLKRKDEETSRWDRIIRHYNRKSFRRILSRIRRKF